MGTVDRIDSVEGGLKVVDYKTSSTKPKGVKDDSGNLGIDVQLPVYMHLAAQVARGHGSVVNGVYYSLTSGSVMGKAKPDIEPLIPLTDKIKQSIRMGVYPVDPDSKEGACSYCELDILCRKGPYLHRKSEETL
jgi:ATP-dependent helicase/DNAse subunit B